VGSEQLLKHILVTGATGFVGSHLCRALLNKGFKVTGLSHTRKSVESLDSDTKEFQLVNCDIIEKNDLIRVIKQMDEHFDCIFHTAGQVYQKHVSSEIYFQRNFMGTFNLLDCCRIFNIKKFILSSSISVYGLHVGQFKPNYLPVDEKHIVNPHPSDFYGISKYLAEKLCKCYYEIFGISSIILRYSRVYGPHMNNGPIFELVKKALSNEPIIGYGNVSTDFVFVDDVVKANLASLEKVHGFEIYNIGSGEEMTYYEILSKIIGISHSSSRLKYSIEPRSRFSLDISKAKRDLSYEPIRIEKGLMEYFDNILSPQSRGYIPMLLSSALYALISSLVEIWP
jgi:UDP-glucose 4-epimerase